MKKQEGKQNSGTMTTKKRKEWILPFFRGLGEKIRTSGPGAGCSLRSQGSPFFAYATVHRTLAFALATGSPRGGLFAPL
ncbi:MAG: hypothetical protein J5586_07510, partial [Clostridia bacterium]|nr:hypothetical protein [Clostridia bacterium]